MAPETEAEPRGEVVSLIFLRDGQVLLEERLEQDKFYGKCTFLGGQVDPEDHVDGQDYREVAAAREAEEEIMVTPTSFQHLISFSEVTPNGNLYVFHVILIKEWQGEPRNQEGAKRKLVWATLAEAKNLLGDSRVQQRIFEELQKVVQ